MKQNISKENILNFKKTYLAKKELKISRNALTQSQINDVAMDWDTFSITNHEYSDIIKNEFMRPNLVAEVIIMADS